MPDFPNPANSPPEIDGKQTWSPGTGLDPARRVPYTKFKFALPKIIAGNRTFVWPTGIEGFTRSGSSLLGIHKYLGRNYVDVHQIHRDEAHIEMTGTFAGLTSRKNMADLIDVLTASGPKQLYLPGVFARIQNVFSENYSFNHEADDRTHSISYTISFVRTTPGARINEKINTVLQAANPTQNANANVKSLSQRQFSTTDSTRTLRSVSNAVYGDPDKYHALVNLNSEKLSQANPDTPGIYIPSYMLPIVRLPIATRIIY